MCQTVYIDCKQSRIGKNNLFLALGCRVTVKAGLHICQKQSLDLRKLLKKSTCGSVCMSCCLFRFLTVIKKCDLNLVFQSVINIVQSVSHIILRKYSGTGIRTEISRKYNGFQISYYINDHRTVRQTSAALRHKKFFGSVILSKSLRNLKNR